MLLTVKNSSQKRGGNKIYLGPDNIVCCQYYGDQTGIRVKKVWRQLEKIAKSLKQQGKRVLVFSDITYLGEMNLDARKAAIEIIQSLDFDKAAVFGCNFINNGLVKLIIVASGRGFKVRIFESRTDAKSWLKT